MAIARPTITTIMATAKATSRQAASGEKGTPSFSRSWRYSSL